MARSLKLSFASAVYQVIYELLISMQRMHTNNTDDVKLKIGPVWRGQKIDLIWINTIFVLLEQTQV